MIRSFKSGVRKRNLNAIQKYIAENPMKWDLDKNNPMRLGSIHGLSGRCG